MKNVKVVTPGILLNRIHFVDSKIEIAHLEENIVKNLKEIINIECVQEEGESFGRFKRIISELPEQFYH